LPRKKDLISCFPSLFFALSRVSQALDFKMSIVLEVTPLGGFPDVASQMLIVETVLWASKCLLFTKDFQYLI